MLRLITISILFSLIICSENYAQRPCIIQFGWYYPDIKQLTSRIDSIQNTPFDGISFSLQRTIMDAFDTVSKSENYFEYKKLSAIKWGRYKNNFIIVRGCSKTGGNWFDDSSWIKIEKNITGLSKAIKAGNLKGILFDPEYYYKDSLYNPWTYSTAQYPNHRFYEVQAQVKKRGIQFITALQRYKNSFNFLSIWATSLIAEDMKTMPLEKTRQALLISFIEGVIEGKNKLVTVTDGNELAYWYKKPSQYIEAAADIRSNAAKLMLSEKTKKKVSAIAIAQPVYYDATLGKVKGFNTVINNDNGWKCLEETLKYAFATTDSIVWLYSERLNCWLANDNNDTLYNVIQNIKNEMQPTVAKRKAASTLLLPKMSVPNINKGKGYYYLNNAKAPLQTGDSSFSFSVNRKKNTVTINFNGKIPVTISAYSYNRLILEVKPDAQIVTLNTGKQKKSKLVMIAKYEDKTESSAIYFY